MRILKTLILQHKTDIYQNISTKFRRVRLILFGVNMLPTIKMI